LSEELAGNMLGICPISVQISQKEGINYTLLFGPEGGLLAISNSGGPGIIFSDPLRYG
jgi:hypothetical protein